MADDKIEATEVAGKTRRSFVKTAAQVAVTAPAVAMLLTASTKKASAQALYGAIDDTSLHSGDNPAGPHGGPEDDRVAGTGDDFVP